MVDRSGSTGAEPPGILGAPPAPSPEPFAMPRRHPFTSLAVDAAQGVGFLAAAAVLTREPPAARLAMAGYGLFALAVVALSDRAPGPRRPTRREADLIRRERAARQSLVPMDLLPAES